MLLTTVTNKDVKRGLQSSFNQRGHLSLHNVTNTWNDLTLPRLFLFLSLRFSFAKGENLKTEKRISYEIWQGRLLSFWILQPLNMGSLWLHNNPAQIPNKLKQPRQNAKCQQLHISNITISNSPRPNTCTLPNFQLLVFFPCISFGIAINIMESKGNRTWKLLTIITSICNRLCDKPIQNQKQRWLTKMIKHMQIKWKT